MERSTAAQRMASGYDKNVDFIVDMDNIGWTLRYFKISNKSDELLWHCVYSNTNRISIGYRIINNLKP